MLKTIIAIGVLVLVLAVLLATRLYIQAAALNGPAGGSGEIEGVDVDLSARISARVANISVTKGAVVKKGDLLLTLDCSDQQAMLSEAEARLAAAQAQAGAAKASLEASQRSQEALAAGESAALAQAEALAAQREAAERQAKRLVELAFDVAEASRDKAQASAEGLSHQESAARAQVQASIQQRRAAGAAVRAADAQSAAAQAAIRAGEAAVLRARLLTQECQIRAPRDSIVTELPFEVSELVAAGQILVRLADITEVKATFYLANAELSYVKTGAEAIVIADAWPNEKFKGKVTNVSVRAEFTPRNIQTRSDRDRLVYPIEVILANPDYKLRPGMPVQVTLLQAGR
ncbi:MAG: HlyD family efflux transporter periplasmic adaptor subunit [Deltaproteobacteria bacterium]|nr:HlyD family efflux transporter periplasmic adaptor subunit [Deltaproteobacteria bacterium]